MSFESGFSAVFGALQGARRNDMLAEQQKMEKARFDAEQAEAERQKRIREETGAAMAAAKPEAGYTVAGADSPFYRTDEGASEAAQMARIRNHVPGSSRADGSATPAQAAAAEPFDSAMPRAQPAIAAPSDQPYDSGMPRAQPTPAMLAAAAEVAREIAPQAAFQVAGRQYAGQAEADGAARQANALNARLERAADVQARHGNVKEALAMQEAAKKYANENFVEALDAGLATGDWGRAKEIFNSTGKIKVDGDVRAEPVMRKGPDGTQIQDYGLSIVKPDGSVQFLGSAFDLRYKAQGIEAYRKMQQEEVAGGRAQNADARAAEEAGRARDAFPLQQQKLQGDIAAQSAGVRQGDARIGLDGQRLVLEGRRVDYEGQRVANDTLTTDAQVATASAGVRATEAQTDATRAGIDQQDRKIANDEARLTRERNEKGAERRAEANEALALLKQAEPLIDLATSSKAGALVDAAGALVGKSTPGAQAAAQLKALEGALIAKMPKMSGPQSDKDVLLYKQMAGQIGDPTVPADTKRAAIKTIREIQQRNAAAAAPAPASPATGTPRPPPAPGTMMNGYRFRGGNPNDPAAWARVY